MMSCQISLPAQQAEGTKLPLARRANDAEAETEVDASRGKTVFPSGVAAANLLGFTTQSTRHSEDDPHAPSRVHAEDLAKLAKRVRSFAGTG